MQVWGIVELILFFYNLITYLLNIIYEYLIEKYKKILNNNLESIYLNEKDKLKNWIILKKIISLFIYFYWLKLIKIRIYDKFLSDIFEYQIKIE